MPRPSLLPAALLGTAALLPTACGGGPPPPNVVLVTLDTTRSDVFGCYGNRDHPTPAFDALAAEGQLFEHALSSAAVTPVSHASILTGLDPYRHGLRVLSADGGFRLPEGVPTLGTILKRAGYATAAVHSAYPVSSHFGFDRDFDVFLDFDAKLESNALRDRWDVATYQRRSDETTDLVLETLDRLPEPFFLWIHYWDPHDAKRLPPEEFLARYPPDASGWSQRSRHRYETEVRWLDGQFGRLLDALRERGRYEDTLFAVTADHGEGLGEHGWPGHRLLYEEQIHVPLILRLPGAEPGVRVEDLVRTTDIVPTLLDYLSLSLPGELDGRSLRPLIEGRPDAARIAYADQINGYDRNANILRRRPNDDFLYCLVEAPWKLLYNPSHPDRCELFQLARDPDELVDHWEDEPEVRDRLLEELARRAPWVTRPFPPDASVAAHELAGAQQALADLGYTEGVDDAPGEDRWEWTCVRHPEVALEAPGPCPQCGRPPLLRAKGAQ